MRTTKLARQESRSTIEQNIRELREMVEQNATKQDIADVRADIQEAKQEILGAIYGRRA